jgi:hypothetical protein
MSPNPRATGPHPGGGTELDRRSAANEECLLATASVLCDHRPRPSTEPFSTLARLLLPCIPLWCSPRPCG